MISFPCDPGKTMQKSTDLFLMQSFLTVYINEKETGRREETNINTAKTGRSYSNIISTVFAWFCIYRCSTLSISVLQSQCTHLDKQIEAHIFEVLLTLFNLSLTLVVSYNTVKPQYVTMAYFLSGAFVLLNMCMNNLLGHHQHFLTFTINSVIMAFPIK